MCPAHSKMYRSTRNYNLTQPLFHTLYTILARFLGTVSGSGYTSDNNSLCNWTLNTILLQRYCKIKGINFHTLQYKIFVCGDDLLLAFKNHKFDHNLYFELAQRDFLITMRLEISIVPSGICKVFFLGSLWHNGKPIRSEKHMVASTIFGTGNFPKMSTNELLQSRFIEVFGNSSDCKMYFSRLNIQLRTRFYFFSELSSPHRFNTEYRIKSLKERSTGTISSRGFWYDRNLKLSELDYLWTER
jgi:hypothetical protein